MYTYHVKEMSFVSTCKRSVIKCSVYAALLLVVIMMALVPLMLPNQKNLRNRQPKRFPTDLKYILFWNDTIEKKKTARYSDKNPPLLTGQEIFIKQKCPVINCYITYNQSLLGDPWNFDAIVFDIEKIKNIKLEQLNLSRSLHQKYIFRSLETSEKIPMCHKFYDNFFNWTWTYKLSSDIIHPFFKIYDQNNTLVGPRTNMTWNEDMKRSDTFTKTVKKKKKAVAWIVSKCKLKAMYKDFLDDFQHELKSYNYTLDIFGPCGKNDCPQGQSTKCYKMIEDNYFFQLALEDSTADDYVTDKLLKVLNHVTIPIVVGGADYANFGPPGGYINAQLFDMKKLGAIMDYLIKNPKMYEKFFDWKNHYQFVPNPNNHMCDLCTKMNYQKDFEESKSYGNLREWWNPDFKDICQRWQLFNMFSKDYL